MASLSSALLNTTLAFCRRAREERLPVTPAKVLDIMRALPAIDTLNEGDFRLALRVNIATSREEETNFERLFDEFFRGVDGAPPWHSRLRGESMQGSMGHHFKELDQEVTTALESYSADDISRGLNLGDRWDKTAPPLDQIIRELAKKLATRPSRRTRQSPHGKTIDIRRSVRRNVRYGMDLVQLARMKKRTRKTRIVMLADVSGSMDAFNPFLLRLMFGLQQALKNSRTLVFSTHVTEITALLRRKNLAETLREVGDTVRHWSGGTYIGGALASLNRGVLREGAAGSTVVIILSDGYDNGDTALIAREMQVLKRRAETVVWINPMFGASTFKVRAAGMKAALPFVDHFLPAFDTKSLSTLVRELAEI